MKDVIFVRHNWNDRGYEDINDHLFEKNLIGIHFENAKNPFDPESYIQGKSGKSAINILNKCHEAEHLVVAKYKDRPNILIGLSRVGSRSTFSSREEKQIKTIELVNVKIATFAEFALPFLVAPPFSTIVRWKMGQRAVNDFYFENASEPKPEHFQPWQLEMIAEEWLRRKDELHANLFKIGKYMEGFDIVGVNKEGVPVLAQVKLKASPNEVDEFWKKINSYGACRAWFFSGNEITGRQTTSIIELLEDMDAQYLRAVLGGNLFQRFCAKVAP